MAPTSTPPAEADLPSLPGDWMWSTRTENTLVAYDRATTKAITIYETPPERRSPPDRGWSVVGLASFGDRTPVFVDGASMAAALSRLEAVAEAIDADDYASVSIVHDLREDAISSPDESKSDPAPSRQSAGIERDESPPSRQASLEKFGN